MINQAESLIDSKEREREAGKERRNERVARKHEAPIFPTTVEQTFSPFSLGFVLVFLIPADPPVTSPSSWSFCLDFLRICLEEAINHLVARTDGPQFGEHFYLTVTLQGRYIRAQCNSTLCFLVWIMKHKDKCFHLSQIRNKFEFFKFKSSNLLIKR